MSTIHIQGARTHNLKNIDVKIPRNSLTIITGLSGSGKSSLAFDTLYAEGQRRYVESLSAYARQFLSVMEKPDVDLIEGLSPAIAIEQKATSHHPRSTVGTITEIYDYLRLLFARVGDPICPQHHVILNAKTVSQIVDEILALPENTKAMILAPLVQHRKGEHIQLFKQLQSQGYVKARVNGNIIELDDPPPLALHQKHTIEVVIDRFKVQSQHLQRLNESVELALKLSKGQVGIASLDNTFPEQIFSSEYACPTCGYSLNELEPRLFSFNNPMGACPTCNGLGVHPFIDPKKVVHNAKISLSAGAIRGYDQRSIYYYGLLSSLAQHYDFSLDVPFETLPHAIQHIILYGSQNKKIRLQFHPAPNKTYTKTQVFEGIIPSMERHYKTSSSDVVRESLSRYLSYQPCETCHGSRLSEAARHVLVGGQSLAYLIELPIDDLLVFFKNLQLTGAKKTIAHKINQELISRLHFLNQVGLDYLTLNRSAETLSGGEAQRIRLASQIGSGLVGVMYILDEPSIGLHQRDNAKLIQTLKHLRDLGNTVIVVEHDEEAIRAADYVIDIGPLAGKGGGQVVAAGPPLVIENTLDSLTGRYLKGIETIPIPTQRKLINLAKQIHLKGVSCHNLKNLHVSIPIGLMTCITGVSGSGKSSLVNDTLYPMMQHQLHRQHVMLHQTHVETIEGLHHLDQVIDIDQSPIGRTPRSNPATYTGLFTPIRELFAQTVEARSRGYTVSRFSFNVKGGRCEACEGDGLIRVAMHFLPDVFVPCDVCQGKRYNRETLGVFYKGKNMDDILNFTVQEAFDFFHAIPVIAKKCQTLIDVGLSYIHLGQSATTLSGGEAQRIKLAKELSKRATGRTLYILDEPTTGLHFHDIKQLLAVLHCLRDQGNTILVIEHHLDVIKTADWIIDLGPEGGHKGGQIIAQGPPETIATHPTSYTGQYLKRCLPVS